MNTKFVFGKCSCGKELIRETLSEKLQLFDNGSIHINGSCSSCDKYFKYIPYRDSDIVKYLLRTVYEHNTGKMDCEELSNRIDLIPIKK